MFIAATLKMYLVSGYAIALALTLLNGLFSIPIRILIVQLFFMRASARILELQFFLARWNCHKTVVELSKLEQQRVFDMHFAQWRKFLPFSVTIINEHLIFGSIGSIAGNRFSDPDDPLLGVCFWLDFREFEAKRLVTIWTRSQLAFPRKLTRALCQRITKAVVATLTHS